MGNNISAEQLREEFDKLDVDKSGFLELEELKKVLKGRLPEAQIFRGLKLVDMNEDGKVSFEEFLNIVNPIEEYSEKITEKIVTKMWQFIIKCPYFG